MEQQAQGSIAANVDLDIPDSDLVETNLLWSIVSMPPAPGPSKAASANQSTTATSPPAKRTKRKSTAADSMTEKPASIDDVDFEATVLVPRGVKVLGDPSILKYELPFEHFDTKGVPGSGKIAFYQGLHKAKMEVFLDGCPEFARRVTTEYRTADSWKLNERRFANLAIRYFLQQEVMDMDCEKTGKFLAERKDEESIQPNSYTSWQAFPILEEDENTKQYNFALSPDASYWLSIQAFGSAWTSIARNYTYVPDRRSMSPYLTVEFKKKTQEPAYRKAVNQMACAAVLGQFNRWKLRNRVMKVRQDVFWTDEDDKAIRHYGLIISAAQFEIWIAEAQITKNGEWVGAQVRRLSEGELKGTHDVNQLVDWINEIHHWGLGVYCEAVRDDVRLLGENDGRSVPEYQ